MSEFEQHQTFKYMGLSYCASFAAYAFMRFLFGVDALGNLLYFFGAWFLSITILGSAVRCRSCGFLIAMNIKYDQIDGPFVDRTKITENMFPCPKCGQNWKAPKGSPNETNR